MCFPSGAQKYQCTGLWLSFVIGCGFVPSVPLTQTLTTPCLSGASQLSCEPSGESCGSLRSAFPKSTARGISAGGSARTETTIAKSRSNVSRFILPSVAQEPLSAQWIYDICSIHCINEAGGARSQSSPCSRCSFLRAQRHAGSGQDRSEPARLE